MYLYGQNLQFRKVLRHMLNVKPIEMNWTTHMPKLT